MNNNLEINKIIIEITPLCQKAADANTDFRKKWEIGTAKSGTKFKGSDYYVEAMKRLKTATSDINSVLIPALDALRSGDLAELNTLLAFLKIDTTFFRSGNLKDNICITLKNSELSDEYKLIIQQIIIDQLPVPGKSFRHFAKLGPKVQSPQFIKQLEALSNSSDNTVAKHATKVIDWIEVENENAISL